jgi:hypothetical protein
MTYKLMLLDNVEVLGSPVYRIIERNFDSVTQAQNAKRCYTAAREGVVIEAKEIAEELGLRSPWKIEEDK